MLQYTIVVGHVVRRLYSTGGMAGGVMSTMNNAIFEIVKREFAYKEKKIRCYVLLITYRKRKDRILLEVHI
jgi:hypothetical protein